MTYIPDGRKDEFYNQKYLLDKDAEFVAGLDWCRIFAVENFFDNLDIYESEFDEDTEEDNEEFNLISYLEEHEEIRNKLREVITQYIEMERDELVTSMIDNMEEDEFEKRKKKVDEGKAKNCLSEYEFEIEDSKKWE